MSVILFGAQELAQVYKVVRPQRMGGGIDSYTIEQILTLNKANTACYNYRYNAKEEALTRAELEHAIAHTEYGQREASSCLGLMAYNCREDKDYLAETEGGHEALISLASSLIHAMADRIEEMERKTKATPAPAPKPSPAPTARPSPASWAKLPGGSWGIRAPGAKSGDVVLASRRDGRSCLMRLTGTVDASKGLFEAEKADSIDQRVASYVSEGLGEF